MVYGELNNELSLLKQWVSRSILVNDFVIRLTPEGQLQFYTSENTASFAVD